jgi:cysteinyl-tRNA synthetase
VGRDDLAEMLGVLGLDNLLESIPGPPPEVIELAEARLAARAAREFGLADDLRDEIAELGWIVRDTATGFEFEPAG